MVAESRQRKKEWGRPTVVSTGAPSMQCWGFSKKAPPHGGCSVQQVKHSPQEHKQHL